MIGNIRWKFFEFILYHYWTNIRCSEEKEYYFVWFIQLKIPHLALHNYNFHLKYINMTMMPSKWVISLYICLFRYGRVYSIGLIFHSPWLTPPSSRVLIYLLLLSLLAIWATYTMLSDKCDKIFVFTVPTRPIVRKSNCHRI